MYHVPTDDTWDAQSIVELLRNRDLDACILDDAVQITLPSTQRFSIIGKLVQKLFRPRPLSITITFCPEKFIRNVDLKYDVMKMPSNCPCFDDITDAMHHRGYLTEDDREIAARYWPSSAELAKLFEQIDELQIQMEDFVAKQDFENAVVAIDKEKMIRNDIDAMLFEVVIRSTNAGICDEP